MISKSKVHDLLKMLAPIRGRLIAACSLQALSSLAGIVPFIAVAETARRFTIQELTPTTIRTIALIVIGAIVLRVITAFSAGALTHFADNDFQLHIRSRMANLMQRLELGWFSSRNSGIIKKSVQDDVAAMHHMVAHLCLDVTSAIILPVLILAYLASINIWLTLLTPIPCIVSLFLYNRLMSRFSRTLDDYNASLGEINTATVEYVHGIEVVKSFNLGTRAQNRLRNATTGFLKAFAQWIRGLTTLSAANEVMLSPAATLVWLCGLGLLFTAYGWMQAMELPAFLLVGASLATPLTIITNSVPQLQGATDAAHRVLALLSEPIPKEPDTPREPQTSDVRFENVSFSYDGHHDVLQNVTFDMPPGTVTALVGPSGSGKSTLANLLLRFADPHDGNISIGGIDLRDIPHNRLGDHVAFIFQDTNLLRTTIKDNIRLARPEASDDEVIRAARLARIHDEIAALPLGYNSVIHEDARFSGGEAQRVAIARALLADRPVLVLDEATAFADPESENEIRSALNAASRGRTVLVIAHRLETIADSDQILVLEDGVVVERGNHEHLLESKGLYYDLWHADMPRQQETETLPHNTTITNKQPHNPHDKTENPSGGKA